MVELLDASGSFVGAHGCLWGGLDHPFMVDVVILVMVVIVVCCRVVIVIVVLGGGC